jgi:hypothetical protein
MWIKTEKSLCVTAWSYLAPFCSLQDHLAFVRLILHQLWDCTLLNSENSYKVYRVPHTKNKNKIKIK